MTRSVPTQTALVGKTFAIEQLGILFGKKRKMKILDCETLESTYSSIENISGVNEQQLKSIFDETNFDDLEDFYYFDKHLFSKVKKSSTSIDFDGVCWFHLTRVGKNTNFSDGILPLQLSVEKVWNFLYSLIKNDFSENEWKKFKDLLDGGKVSRENNSFTHAQRLFQMKTKKQYLGGPYAMLVREIAFNSKQVGNHDYLNMPEIVDDICTCFECVYDIDLTNRYLALTQSCIVKFLCKNSRQSCL